MDNFFIEYRDPMFGIIILFSTIFIISFSNYWWGIFRAKEEEHSIERFIKKFEVSSDANAYKELLNSFKLSTESLVLLAHIYVKSGDFETAIGIYLIALEQIKSGAKKRYVLVELGKCYFKAGFLKRAAEVFLKSLQTRPRDEEALSYLNVCYEMLKAYEKALGVLDALEELGVDVKEQRSYVKAKKVLEDKELSVEEKEKELRVLSKDFALAKRMLVDFKHSHESLKVEDLGDTDPQDLIDFVWFLDADEFDLSTLSHPIYKSIATLKGQCDAKDSSGVFEFEVLNILKQQGYEKAELGFEFTCKECKNSFPMFFCRCPNCRSLSSMKIEPILISKDHETHTPFL